MTKVTGLRSLKMMKLWSRLNRGYNYCRHNPWPVVLFLLGAAIRILYIGSIPGGLNQDEASIGYDAYAILHYGIDRNGIHLPVHLISWGSGQNALYAYLSMPFILLFGCSAWLYFIFFLKLPLNPDMRERQPCSLSPLIRGIS
ncbi:hypothetical protein PaeBR_02820 [Paenibacillus sp. BR2-3]|uniref:hypothetical protein n=1 Tax=Paenibacillus sp. BR2-3 TaxID=3048494 RepID=UPI003977C9EF